MLKIVVLLVAAIGTSTPALTQTWGAGGMNCSRLAQTLKEAHDVKLFHQILVAWGQGYISGVHTVQEFSLELHTKFNKLPVHKARPLPVSPQDGDKMLHFALRHCHENPLSDFADGVIKWYESQLDRSN